MRVQVEIIPLCCLRRGRLPRLAQWASTKRMCWRPNKYSLSVANSYVGGRLTYDGLRRSPWVAELAMQFVITTYETP